LGTLKNYNFRSAAVGLRPLKIIIEFLSRMIRTESNNCRGKCRPTLTELCLDKQSRITDIISPSN
jgi:hypothetical protein